VDAARPHGAGSCGSIPLLAALATRLEQATAAEAIIRRAGCPPRQRSPMRPGGPASGGNMRSI
jgi:hypothetical protein